MKYCSNCGTKMNDEALFCQACGNKTNIADNGFKSNPASDNNPSFETNYTKPGNFQSNPEFNQEQPTAFGGYSQENYINYAPYVKPKKSKKKLIIIIASVVAALLIGLLVIFFFANTTGASSPEDLIDEYEEALEDRDVDALWDLSVYSIYSEKDVEKMSGMDYDDAKKYVRNNIENMLSELADEYGSRYTVSISVFDSDMVTKNDDEFDYYKEQFPDSVKIEAIKVINAEISYSGNGDYDSETAMRYIVKIDGRWYLA